MAVLARLPQAGAAAAAPPRSGKIAREPKFRWFGRFNRRARAEVREYINRARRVGEVPLIATLRHQGRQCNTPLPGRRAAGGRPHALLVPRLRARASGARG